MTCERWERDLALLAGDDLPKARARDVEAHVAGCGRCRDLLDELRGLRGDLAAMRNEPVAVEALANVRLRVAHDLRERQRPRRMIWRLAPLLAGLGLVAGLAWMVRSSSAPVREEPPETSAERSRPGPIAEVTAPTPPRRVPTAPRARTPRPARAERVHVASRLATEADAEALSSGIAPPDAASDEIPRLSPEDADQLARAVVLLSKVKRLSDWPAPEAPDPPADHGLIKLATDDPNVVVYWHVDSNGGES